MHRALDVHINFVFHHNYGLDSIRAAAYPEISEYQEAYQAYLCPNGQKVYRGVTAKCMVAATQILQRDASRTEEGHSGGAGKAESYAAAPLTDPLYTVPSRVLVRYFHCNSENIYCCARTYTICRNPTTGVTSRIITYPPIDTVNVCSATLDPQNFPLNPGEELGECTEYCPQGESFPIIIPGGGELDDRQLNAR
jgi:hypothetical protein